MTAINKYYYQTQGVEVDGVYSGEPACNFPHKKRRPERASGRDADFKVLRLQQLMREDFNLARKTSLYHEVMGWFFGYIGEKQQNIISTMTSYVWYDLRDETTFSYQAWKNLEYAIMNYNADYLQETEELDSGDIEALERTGKNNFMNFAIAVLRRTQRKVIKETKPRSKTTTGFDYAGEDGNTQEYELEDEHSRFDERIGESDGIDQLVKTILDNISGDKDKNRYILNYIVEMYVSDTHLSPTMSKDKADHSDKFNRRELAELMVNAFPGTSRSANERYINRFQNRCSQLDMLPKLNTTYSTKVL